MTKDKQTGNPCSFTDEEMQHLFKVKSSPLFWRQKAEELKFASDLLFPHALKYLKDLATQAKNDKVDLAKLHPGVFDQAFALLGFSLECLFKACIIRDNPKFTDSGKLSRSLWTHDLVLLAGIAKITLNHDEKYTCERLTEVALKDFRYPIDKNVGKERSSGRVLNMPEIGGALYEKLHKTVNQIHGKDGAKIETKFATSKPMIKRNTVRVLGAKSKVTRVRRKD